MVCMYRFMAASKILGEETVAGPSAGVGSGVGNGEGKRKSS